MNIIFMGYKIVIRIQFSRHLVLSAYRMFSIDYFIPLIVLYINEVFVAVHDETFKKISTLLFDWINLLSH